MDAVHGDFCLFALCAWHHQHLCMSACIPDPWATCNKRLAGHEFYIVCADKWLVESRVHPPPLLVSMHEKAESDKVGALLLEKLKGLLAG